MLTRNVSLFATLLTAMFLLLSLKVVQIQFEAIEAFFPERAVLLRPFRHLLEWRCRDPARPPLRLPAAGDEPRPLEHPQVLRNRRHAHFEWFGELGDGALSGGEAGENGPPGRVGECCEGDAEMIGSHDNEPSG